MRTRNRQQPGGAPGPGLARERRARRYRGPLAEIFVVICAGLSGLFLGGFIPRPATSSGETRVLVDLLMSILVPGFAAMAAWRGGMRASSALSWAIPSVGLLYASFVLEAPWSQLAFALGLSLPVLILLSDRFRGWWLELIGRAEEVGPR